MPHNSHRAWIEIQKKHAGFHHPSLRNELDADWIPNADVIEHADGLIVRLEVAGVDHSSIHVIVTRQALVISGRRANPDAGGAAAGLRFRQMEIEYGPFERVLPLPFPVDQPRARARHHDGLLEIELPRAKAATTQKTIISIQW